MRAAAALGLLALLAGCGVKGPPLPPERPAAAPARPAARAADPAGGEAACGQGCGEAAATPAEGTGGR